jgi:hypothetical protein
LNKINGMRETKETKCEEKKDERERRREKKR